VVKEGEFLTVSRKLFHVSTEALLKKRRPKFVFNNGVPSSRIPFLGQYPELTPITMIHAKLLITSGTLFITFGTWCSER